MRDLEPTHRRFLELVSAFYQEAGSEKPLFESDAHTPIAFEACVEDVRFSVGYDPTGEPACLFVYCVLGTVPLTAEAATLRHLLELNTSMLQEQNAAYCIDDSTQELAVYLRRTMDIDVETLLDDLGRIAQLADRWRRQGFMGETPALPSEQEPGEPPSWTVFA